MTKALEAAAEEMAKWDDGYIWENLPENQKNVYRKGAERIIRAYAANVTEEMAAGCYGRVEIEKDAGGNFLRGKRCGSAEQVRAAIERGLV